VEFEKALKGDKFTLDESEFDELIMSFQIMSGEHVEVEVSERN